MTHRYYCHACQAYQDVLMAPTPTCSVCHSQFVEQASSQEATATTHVDIDNDLSERLNQTTLGGAPRTEEEATSNSDTTDDEIYTDDEDEDYEDIDSDDDDYEDEDDDYDEEDEESAFMENFGNPYETRHRHRFYGQDEWDYELDRYYDDILGYNHASDFYDGMDDIAPQWSSYFASHLDIDESHRHWERFLRAMFWPNEDQDRPAPATQNDIDQLEKRQLKEGDAEVDTECSICQEDFGVNNEILTLPCKHEYHGLCIRRWLQVSATCPMCRSTIISEAESQRRQQEEQPQITSHPNNLGGRTFTFTSPDRRHAIGIMVADVTSLPYPPYPEDDVDYYEDYDDFEDEYEEGDYYDSGEEEDEDEEEEDPWDQVDRQEPISHHGWRHHRHGPMFICPHGHLIPGFNRLRRAPPSETAHSTATTTNHPIAEYHQPNPMDEVD